MDTEQIITFAETDFRNQKRRFGVKKSDRRRHMYIVGKTGTGKTTLLENIAIQDLQSGDGVGIVDPHGEFAEKMLDFVPPNRINDVIYFNPSDLAYPIAFNVLEKVDPEYRHLVASGLMGVFKKIWPDVWSARMEYILHNSVLALLEYPGSTLLGINKILSDRDYREKVVSRLTDPSVKSFWINEFAKYPDRFREEAVAPIQNKVGQFISSPLIRNIIGQTKSSMDFREIMDNKKILIMNLSKGKIGEDASRLLGALCITKLQLAAMSRVNIPENERKDFYLHVDEFQNFATESFANILSEARKYRLSLILAHQYIAQLVQGDNTTVKEAVFGNVGTIITFRVGAEDAEFLEPEFMPEFMQNDLVNLGFAQIYLKLMIDGFSSRPFSAITLPPLPRIEKSSREKIIRVSRERYAGLSREVIEDKISRWSGSGEETGMAPKAFPKKDGASSKKQFSSDNISSRQSAGPVFIENCWECGKKVEISFKPDGVRPIYCRDCLILSRSQGGQSHSVNSSKKIEGAGHNENSLSWKKTEAPSREKSQPIIRQTGEAISLGEALGRRPAEFKPQKKQRRELNLSDLRSVLNEVVPSENINTSKPQEVKSKPKTEADNKKTDSKEKELKPGESVEL